MKRYLFLALCTGMLFSNGQISAQTVLEAIQGQVVDEEGVPIPNVTVSKLNSFEETETNEAGNFTIKASEGDVLRFAAIWKKPLEIEVGTTSNLQVEMKANMELLQEVLVTTKRKKEEEVTTAFGKRKKSSVGYQTKAMEDFIGPADIDLTDVVKKWPGITWKGNGFTFQFFLRRSASITSVPVLVIFDGVPVQQNYLSMVDPSTIETITLLQGLVGAVRYGTLGAGGVMLVETKMYASLNEEEKEVPKLLVENNDFDENLSQLDTFLVTREPAYIQQLKNSGSFSEAKATYLKLRRNAENNTLRFYLDCADYFQKWEPSFAYEVLTEIFDKAENNPRILKTLAYQLEESGHLNQAKFLYEKILELRPQHVQAYRDLALIYTQTQDYEVAKALYIQMLRNSVPGVDFGPIQSTIANEFQHFLLNNRSKVSLDNIPSDFLVASNTPKIRLVLEWTDPLSEFEVQFVGPQKKYFVWNHSPYGESDFIENEIKEGFSIKEFEIDKVPPGEWLVNIRNLEPESTTGRAYLRYTLYKDYGFPSEEKKSMLVALDKIDEKIILDSFLN